MTYYDKDKSRIKINTKKMEYINSGSCGNVYKDNDIAFKIYTKCAPKAGKLKLDRFNFLVNIDNPHFIKLINIYTKSIFKYSLKKEFKTDAYSYKYCIADETNLLEKNVDYLVNNLYELEKLFIFFSNNHILTDDIRYHNVVLGKEYITIIDPDSFMYITDSKNYLSIRNKENLKSLLASLFFFELSDNNYCTKDKGMRIIYSDLLNFKVSKDTEITDIVSKKLTKYKTIKDYFIDKKY